MCVLPLYSFILPRSETCKEGKLGLKSEKHGREGELATLQRTAGFG